MTQTINSGFGIDVSRMTISRSLKNNGLSSAEKLLKPMLFQKNIKARLEFANAYKKWTVEDWKKLSGLMKQKLIDLVQMEGHGTGLETIQLYNLII